MKNAVRTPLTSILAAVVLQAALHAQGLQAQALQATGPALQKIDNVCAPEDAEALGLSCSEEEPCPVYLELSSIDGFGANIFLTGNLHTMDTTLAAVLVASADAGKTWSEPAKRVRAAALEQIQFVDTQHGWASGMLLDPLPRGPFLLSTVNGGELWHKTPLSPDLDFGSIQQFWFDSSSRGQLVVDRSQGKTARFEVYATTDGGDTWALKASSDDPISLPGVRPQEKANWRTVAEKDSYRVELRTAAGWETLARFSVRAGECK